MHKNITCNAYIYGLTFYGNSATTDNRSMINIMFASAHEPWALTDAGDYRMSMSEGEVKYACDCAFQYIQ